MLPKKQHQCSSSSSSSGTTTAIGGGGAAAAAAAAAAAERGISLFLFNSNDVSTGASERASQPTRRGLGGGGFWGARHRAAIGLPVVVPPPPPPPPSPGRAGWLAGWLASHPRGALGTAPRPLLSPPLRGYGRRPNPKVFVSPAWVTGAYEVSDGAGPSSFVSL